jgi:catechol 2,3-dioxygenase-like lactoylglutathione lyase family enzyme
MTRQPTTLGAFSASLAVKNLKPSQAFYEKLGFEQVLGDPAQNWLILRNGTATIGLFRAYSSATPDLQPRVGRPGSGRRGVHRPARASGSPQVAGLKLTNEADESSRFDRLKALSSSKGTGPASFIVVGPDGNPVFIDQHV